MALATTKFADSNRVTISGSGASIIGLNGNYTGNRYGLSLATLHETDKIKMLDNTPESAAADYHHSFTNRFCYLPRSSNPVSSYDR